MKPLIILFFIIISLQSWTKADDIRDFEIEGISVGDSALKFFSIDHINKNSYTYPGDDKFKRIQSDNLPFFKLYDAVDFTIKKNDQKFKIYSLNGILIFKHELINKCYDKMHLIEEDMDRMFSDLKKWPKRSYKHRNDKSQKSIVTDIEYEFKNGDMVRLVCYDYSEEYSNNDHLAVNISTNEYKQWLINEAY